MFHSWARVVFVFLRRSPPPPLFLHPRGELVTITLTRVLSRVGCCPQEKKRETKQNTKKNNGQIIIIKTKKLDFPFRVVAVVALVLFFFSGDDWGEITRDLEAMILFVFSLPKRFDIKMMSLTLWFLIFHRDFTPSIDRHVHRSQLYYLANGLCPYRKENSLAVTAL